MAYQESEKTAPRMGENYSEITCLIRNPYPKYIKNPYKSTTKRQVTQLKKWAKDLNRDFSKEGM